MSMTWRLIAWLTPKASKAFSVITRPGPEGPAAPRGP